MSSRLPYYRMYPKDFDADERVRLMTMCELGLYIRCLNHAWINKSLPNDITKIAKIVGEPIKNVKRSWPAVSRCFVENESGALINERLEKERKWAIERSLNSKNAVEIRDSKKSPERILSIGEGLEKGDHPRAGARAESESESESYSSAVSVEGGMGESDLDLEDDIGTFLQNSSRRCGGPRIKLGRRQDEQITERVIAAEGKHGSREFRAAWLTFLPYCKENPVESPIGYFLASVERWLMETKPPKPEMFEQVRPQSATAVETLPAVIETVESFVGAQPPRFRHLIGLFLVSGKEVLLPKVKAAAKRWGSMTEDQGEGSIRYAEAKFPNTAPEYIPSPDRFLESEPWTAVRMERVLPAAPVNGRKDMAAVNASALRIAEERAAARARGEFVF